MNIITNKKGMTLVELMVYIVIAAFLLAPVVLLMHNSSISMTRDSANTDLRITGRDILNIMYDDFKNTGFKIRNMADRSVDSMVLVCTDSLFGSPDRPNCLGATNKDWSSIEPVDGSEIGTPAFDELTVYSGRLNDGGNWVGYDIYQYYVDVADSSLTRLHFEYDSDGNETSYDSIVITRRNIEALQFQYADELGLDWLNGDEIGPDVGTSNRARDVKFIKVAIVLKDEKKVGASKVTPGMTVGNYDLPPHTGGILRERFEMVVPIYNNGLFPPAPPPPTP